MTESTIKGKSHSTIKGTRVHDLRSRSIIYRPPSTLLGKPTVEPSLRKDVLAFLLDETVLSRLFRASAMFSTSRVLSLELDSGLDSKLRAQFSLLRPWVRLGFGSR